jgi:hypothetical protein
VSIEAMKQALDALEEYGTHYARHEDDYIKAITALRQAIEQAESLDKLVAENQRLGLYDDEQPTCQENRQVAKNATTEWVGLTDEEVHDAFNFVEFIKQISFDRDRPEWCENFAAYIEAKLKEKNT